MVEAAAPRVQAPARGGALTGARLATGATALAVALLPVLLPHGPANLAPVDVFIVTAIWLGLVWAGSGHPWRFPYAVPTALFIVGGCLGALAGPVPGQGFQAVMQDVFLLGWCWTIANVGASHERLKTIVTTWVYASIAWGTLLFAALAFGYTPLTGQTETEGSRTSLTLGDPSYAANYFFVSLMLIWATGRPRNRVVRLLAYGILLAAVVSTGSNSGLVSLVAGTIIAAVAGVYRRRGLFAAVTVFAFVGVAGAIAVSQTNVGAIRDAAHGSRYAFIRDGIGRSDVSEEYRTALLEESVPLYLRGGPLGQGPVSTKTRLEEDLAPVVKEAHDDYLAALLERGVIGLAGLLLLLGTVTFRSLGLTGSRLRPEFEAVIARPNALLGAILGTFVASTVYELLHLRHLWALFGIVAALYIWGRD
jgi:O-antigen ligase